MQAADDPQPVFYTITINPAIVKPAPSYQPASDSEPALPSVCTGVK